VPQDKLDPLLGTQIGDPVPGEHALAANDQALAVGRDGVQQRGGQDGVSRLV